MQKEFLEEIEKIRVLEYFSWLIRRENWLFRGEICAEIWARKKKYYDTFHRTLYMQDSRLVAKQDSAQFRKIKEERIPENNQRRLRKHKDIRIEESPPSPERIPRKDDEPWACRSSMEALRLQKVGREVEREGEMRNASGIFSLCSEKQGLAFYTIYIAYSPSNLSLNKHNKLNSFNT